MMDDDTRAPDGDRAARLQRTAFPRTFAAIDAGRVTSDIRHLFLSFAESMDLSWMTDQPTALSTHTVLLPEQGETLQVHGLLLARKSAYFDRLIKYSSGRHLELPYDQFDFLRRSISSIIDFINHEQQLQQQSTFNIRDEDLLELLLAADYLMYQDLLDRLLAYIKGRCSANLGLALDIWAFTQSCYMPELSGLAFDRLLCSFPASADQPQWLGLEFGAVRQVLSHDGLNVGSELTVLEAAVRWLAADWAQRGSLGEGLLACARRGLLNPAELASLSQNEALARYPRLMALYRAYPAVPPEAAELYQRHADVLAAAATPRQPHEAVFLLGGWCQEDRLDQAGPRAACQVFNPRANTWTMWTPSADRPASCIGQVHRRVYAGCILVNDILHIVGGFDGERAINTVSCYNLRAPGNGWYEGSCMTSKRYYVCCAAVGSQVYAIGGHSGEQQERHGGRLDTAERLDVADNCWMPIASMRTVRSDAGAAGLAGRVFVAGGFNGQQYHDTAEMFDPSVDQWTFISRMNFHRGGVSLVAMGNTLYAVGGNDGQSRLAVVEAYQNEYDGWVFAGRMSRQKSNLSTAVLQDGIMVMGGWSDQPTIGILSAVEKFSPVGGGNADSTVQLADMSYAASATSACTAAGRELVARYLVCPRPGNPWTGLRAGGGEAELTEPLQEAVSTDSHFIQSSQEAETAS